MNAVAESRSLSTLEMVLRSFASAKAEQLILWQTAMWRRRAKLRWCVSGDESNKFFHAAANCHARRNKIRVLVHEGVEFYDDQLKLQLATSYYAGILGQPSPSLPTVQLHSLCDHMDLSCLDHEFSWAEILEALNHSPNNRSPGPDGFTNEF